jgi:phage terminase large subunit GpA-like protein
MFAPSPVTSWMGGFEPQARLTCSEWTGAERYLPETSAARGGRYHLESVPALRGILDTIHEPGVRKIAIRKAAQVGMSEGLLSIVGYLIAHDPSPTILMLPTINDAELFSKEKLAPMIRTTPALRALVQDGRGKGDESTLRMKLFPAGYLLLAGGSSPTSFQSRSARVVIGDEVDRIPPAVGDEGSAVDLLMNRTITFGDALAIFCSTPVLKGGQIDSLVSRSDQRQFHILCPKCRTLDYVTWRDPEHWCVRYTDDDPRTARLLHGCGATLDNPGRLAALQSGQWRATATPQEPGLVGYHVPAWLSTFVSLESLVAGWLRAQQLGRQSLKTFVQTSLAEGWEDRDSPKPEPHALLSTREDYGAYEVPEPVVLLTMGVDVQRSRVEALILGWSEDGDRYVIDHEVLYRPPSDDVFEDLFSSIAASRFTHPLGYRLHVAGVAIDSGDQTDLVYKACRFQKRMLPGGRYLWVHATKGWGRKPDMPMVNPTPANMKVCWLWHLNADKLKDDLADALASRRIHFPRKEWCNESFFEQLTAEERRVKYDARDVAIGSYWEAQPGRRNEVLDLVCLAHAAKIIAAGNPARPFNLAAERRLLEKWTGEK